MWTEKAHGCGVLLVHLCKYRGWWCATKYKWLRPMRHAEMSMLPNFGCFPYLQWTKLLKCYKYVDYLWFLHIFFFNFSFIRSERWFRVAGSTINSRTQNVYSQNTLFRVFGTNFFASVAICNLSLQFCNKMVEWAANALITILVHSYNCSFLCCNMIQSCMQIRNNEELTLME